MRLRLLVAVLGLGFSAVGNTADTAIDKQVDNFFAQGIKHCKQAMDLSRTSREVAKAEFERYQSYIGKVEALKPELKNDLMVKRQMEQCDQVGHDIARNEALPIFEQSLAVCKEVKALVKRDHLTKAKAKYMEYTQYRDQALNLTDTVLKVGSNASKERRCNRLEDRIIAAEQRIQYSEIKADRLVSTLRKSTDSCLVSGRMLENVGSNMEKLKAAEAMLSQAQDYFKQTKNYPEAIARSENFPGYESSKKIRQYMVDYGRCEQDVVANITEQKQIFVASQQAAAQEQEVVAAVAAEPAAELSQQPMVEAVVASNADQAPAADSMTTEAVAATEPAAPLASPYEPNDLVQEGLVQMSHDIE